MLLTVKKIGVYEKKVLVIDTYPYNEFVDFDRVIAKQKN